MEAIRAKVVQVVFLRAFMIRSFGQMLLVSPSNLRVAL